ncbi:hypothetical protein D3C77_317470 [compost metagenome]
MRLALVVSNDFANGSELQIAIGDHYQIAPFHASDQGDHTGHCVVICVVYLASRLLQQSLNIFTALTLAVIMFATIPQTDQALFDAIIEDMGIIPLGIAK